MRVLGHRGSRVPGPDNTLAAVVGALDAGADGVEVDLRRCADGSVVLRHDPVVAGRPVVDTAAEVLAALGVPTLAQVLAAARGRGRVVCEVKNAPGDPDHDASGQRTLAATLETLVPADDVVVSSFDPIVAAAAREAGLRSALLTRPAAPLVAALAAASRGGHPELHAHVTTVWLHRGAAARCHDAGVMLTAWTVTRMRQARQLRDGGVDAVIGDDPAGLVRALRGAGAA